MAERQGFEPWVGFRPQRFSRPPRSTTPAPLQFITTFQLLFVVPKYKALSEHKEYHSKFGGPDDKITYLNLYEINSLMFKEVNMRLIRAWLTIVIILLIIPSMSLAADRQKVESFLKITGFDVALESISLSAETAPRMLGLQAEDFGSEWTRLTRDVFAIKTMHEMAVDILEETLNDKLLKHAADFYASELGARLVLAENASHMSEDDELKFESGEAIVAGLERLESERLTYIKRMNKASDSAETGLRAYREVQVRFLMAAAGAGVIELQMEEPDLRERLSSDEDGVRAELDRAAVVSAAYTYQAFSDEEMLVYARALENSEMRQVYDLMNAVQFEVMANRFEALARAMSLLRPSQEL